VHTMIKQRLELPLIVERYARAHIKPFGCCALDDQRKHTGVNKCRHSQALSVISRFCPMIVQVDSGDDLLLTPSEKHSI
jgi:hypothetical protein